MPPARMLAGPGIKAIEATLTSLLTPLLLLHLYPRALLQLTLQTVSSPSTAFSLPTTTDPLLHSDSDSDSNPMKKGKGKKGKARGVATGAGERAATINAAMLAFVDAGVQCRGMLVAVAVAFLPRPPPPDAKEEEGEEEMVLDPTPEEEERATSTHVFAFSFGVGVGGTEGTCVGIDSTGTFSEDQVCFSCLLFASLPHFKPPLSPVIN
jgi:exosome complex component RRP46